MLTTGYPPQLEVITQRSPVQIPPPQPEPGAAELSGSHRERAIEKIRAFIVSAGRASLGSAPALVPRKPALRQAHSIG
jgi:hypothetical protein